MIRMQSDPIHPSITESFALYWLCWVLLLTPPKTYCFLSIIYCTYSLAHWHLIFFSFCKTKGSRQFLLFLIYDQCNPCESLLVWHKCKEQKKCSLLSFVINNTLNQCCINFNLRSWFCLWIAEIDSGTIPLILKELLHSYKAGSLACRIKPLVTYKDFCHTKLLTFFSNFFPLYSLNELAELMKCDILLSTLVGYN